MTKRKMPQAPPLPIPKVFISLEEVDRGLAKLKKRIEEVRALQGVQYPDQKISNVESNIQNTILEIFGSDSLEYKENQYHEIFDGSHYMQMWDSGPDPQAQSNFEAGITKSITTLEGLIARLEEKREDFVASPEVVATAAFHGLSLHPRIADTCSKLYEDGHYPEAVFAAAKCLIHLVQEKSGKYDLDGTNLMRKVFRPKEPVLAFNDLSTQSDLDEQDGMMNLFAGVTLGIKNPRSHSFMTDTADKALEYIGLISLLAKRLDEAREV